LLAFVGARHIVHVSRIRVKRHYLKISVRGSNSEAKDFLFSKIVHIACGAHLSLYSMGIGVTFLGVKCPGRELTTTGVKNE
jgi:hypothetical protein